MINATAHKSRANLCRRDLQFSVRAKIVAAHWEVDNIFRKFLDGGEAELRTLAERHLTCSREECASCGAGVRIACSAGTDHLFADRCTRVLAERYGDPCHERLTLCG